MGEIAEMMLDGTLDQYTGEYIGKGKGYPRSLNSPNYGKNPKTGVIKWLNRNYPNCNMRELLERYGVEVLNISEKVINNTSSSDICFKIQDDFIKFTSFVFKIKNNKQ